MVYSYFGHVDVFIRQLFKIPTDLIFNGYLHKEPDPRPSSFFVKNSKVDIIYSIYSSSSSSTLGSYLCSYLFLGFRL